MPSVTPPRGASRSSCVTASSSISTGTSRYLRFDGVVRVDQDGLWRRARPFALAEGRSLALCPEDMLLHLVLHLTLGSDFARVLWYADIDALIRRYANDLDWARIVDEAARWRIRALLDWSLRVVQSSF